MFSYLIDENNTVLISSPDTKTRWLQPYYPNGEAWEGREAAEAWAILQTAHMNGDKSVGFFPGPSRAEPKIAIEEEPSL